MKKKSHVAPAVLVASLLAPSAFIALISACRTGSRSSTWNLDVASTTGSISTISSSTSSTANGGSDAEPQMAIVAFGVDPSGLTDASVQICGSRPAPDSKYLCISSLGSPDAGAGSDAACPCFVFTDAGIVSTSPDGSAFFQDLCSSSDLAADGGNADGGDQWTFTYSIFASTNCTGALLNDGGANVLTCFDSQDVVAQAHPNASVESLDPGLNSNNILCVTPIVDAGVDAGFEGCSPGVPPTPIVCNGSDRVSIGTGVAVCVVVTGSVPVGWNIGAATNITVTIVREGFDASTLTPPPNMNQGPVMVGQDGFIYFNFSAGPSVPSGQAFVCF